MEIIKTAIKDAVTIELHPFRDGRGYFLESFSQYKFTEKVRKINFAQDSESKPNHSVLRSPHFQKPPYAQNKLAHVTKGSVLGVAVGVRKGSPISEEHTSVELTEENHRQFFIPHGLAHDLVVLTEEVIFQHKCDNFYAPQCEDALAQDDSALKVDWKVLADKTILPEKDQHHEYPEEAGWLFDYNENPY